MNYTLYMHTCPNGKRYIGITKQYPIEKRFKQGNGYKKNIYFYRAIQKYGWENIKHEVLSNWLSKEKAEEQERLWIERYKTNNSDYGYNLTTGGEEGTLQTKETKEKISKALKGRTFSDEHRKNLSKWQKGLKKPYNSRKISDKQKKILSEIRIGKNLSKETKEKISKSLLGNNRAKKRPVNQLSLCGKFIKRYESISDASRELSHKSHETIIRVCKGSLKTACGYRWEYAEK